MRRQSHEIQYRVGDATDPERLEGCQFILHIVNDIGAWGSGFVVAVSDRWPEPEAAYRAWSNGNAKSAPAFRLGTIQCVRVEEGLCVINMVAQQGVRSSSNPIPIRYHALRLCLESVVELADRWGAVEIVMPRIGCDRGGGTWDQVEPILASTVAVVAPVAVYDLPG